MAATHGELRTKDYRPCPGKSCTHLNRYHTTDGGCIIINCPCDAAYHR